MSFQSKINSDFLEIKSQFSKITKLEEMECIIYFHLLNSGPKSAGEISKELGVERSKAYRLVQDMAEDGWLLSTFNSPMRYYPLDPLKLINTILKRKEVEIEELAKKKAAILKKLGQTSFSERNYSYTYKTLTGKRKIYPAIYKLIQENSKIIYIVSSLKELERLFTPIIEKSLKEFKKEGGIVRLMTDKQDELEFPDFISGVEHQSVIRHSKGRIVVGEQSILITMIPEQYPHEEVCLYTDSMELVKNFQNLCQFWWTIK